MPQGGSLTGAFGYTGQMWLPEVGAYHYKNRAYLPNLGVFAQTDPIGYADSPNLYAYVGNDPVNRVDPLGLDDILIIGTVAAVSGSTSSSGGFSAGFGPAAPIVRDTHSMRVAEQIVITGNRRVRVQNNTGAPLALTSVTTVDLDAAKWQMIRLCSQNQQSADCTNAHGRYLELFHRYSQQHPLPAIPQFKEIRPDPWDTVIDLVGCVALDAGVFTAVGAAAACAKGAWELGHTVIPEQYRVN